MQVNYRDPSNYKKTRKKKYFVYACIAPDGVRVRNVYERSEYVTQQGNNVIISGTTGEQWVMPNNKLVHQYRTADGNPIDNNVLKSMRQRWVKLTPNPSADFLYACFIPKNQRFNIQTSWGAILEVNGSVGSNGKGDFILCPALPNGAPNLNDVWVVDGTIFPATYDIRAFSDCVDKRISDRETPKPNDLPFMRGQVNSSGAKQVAAIFVNKVVSYTSSIAMKKTNNRLGVSKAGVDLSGGDSVVEAGRFPIMLQRSEIGYLDVYFENNGMVSCSVTLPEFGNGNSIDFDSVNYKSTQIMNMCQQAVSTVIEILSMNSML